MSTAADDPETLAGATGAPARQRSMTAAMPMESRFEARIMRIEQQIDLLVEKLIKGPSAIEQVLGALTACGRGTADVLVAGAREIGATVRTAIEQGAVKYLAGAAIVIAALYLGIPLALNSQGVTVGGRSAQEAP